MRKLIYITTLATILRWHRLFSAPYFVDMDWFFHSAHQALTSGKLPILGITASITWLHQGPLWTYFLLLPTAISIPPQILTSLAGVLAVVLAFFVSGVVPALVLAVLPLAVLTSQTAYHTTLIPLFFFLVYASLWRRRPLLAGLFIGFLYQSHLLTFIYWPLWVFLAYKLNAKPTRVLLGFVIGIIPFILAGPIQTLGIFVWIFKGLLIGFEASSGISTAYWQVLLPGGIALLGWVIKWIHAYGGHSRQK